MSRPIVRIRLHQRAMMRPFSRAARRPGASIRWHPPSSAPPRRTGGRCDPHRDVHHPGGEGPSWTISTRCVAAWRVSVILRRRYARTRVTPSGARSLGLGHSPNAEHPLYRTAELAETRTAVLGETVGGT